MVTVTQDTKQTVDRFLENAHVAAAQFKSFGKEKIEEIVKAVAHKAQENSEFYSDWAVRETGYGNAEDKHQKNLLSSISLLDVINIGDFIDPKINHEEKIVNFPKPAGVVVALVPCTNPVATIYYKSIISLITRNAIILCPHPAAKECCVHAANLMAEVAERLGAPKGVIQVLSEPSISVVEELLQSNLTDVILATGGPAMVRASYSSGNPSVGVGPGNVACYVDKSADISTAGAQIIFSNSFDNSLPCTCESVVLADQQISDELKNAMTKAGAYFAVDKEEQKLRQFLFPKTAANVAALGKSAEWVAEQAGIVVPNGTKSLVIEIDEIGMQEPVSKEKMFPVLGYFIVEGVTEGISITNEMLELMGKGHSAVIHANDPLIVARYGASLPVCRIAVNTPGITGSSGMTTNLPQGPVIGTGFFGGSSVDENVGPKQLVQWTRVAYHQEQQVQMGDMDAALQALN